MKVVHCEQIPLAAVATEGAQSVRMRCLLGQQDNAPSFTMRQFELAPGGHTPKHTHNYEHEVFVLEGAGVFVEGDEEHPVGPGIAVLVDPNLPHQFRNTGPGPLKFLCLIPHPLRAMAGSCTVACGCE